MFDAMHVDRLGDPRDAASVAATLCRKRAGFHREVAAMAWTGNNIVMDHVLREPSWFDDCLTVMAGLDVDIPQNRGGMDYER